MKRMIKYPSIEQYRGVVKQITERACYVDKGEDGKAVFDFLKPKPKLTFVASEKIHGTNAGVSYSIPDGIWAQSRENIITVEKDNAGFAFFISQNESVLIDMIKLLAREHNIDLNKKIITLYGEWAGGNIQKNSALSGGEKSFILFEHFKVSPIEPSEEEKAVWYKTIIYSDFGVPNPYIEWASYRNSKIFNIMDYPTYSFEINFNTPDKGINQIIELVDVIEEASPVGKAFGFETNIGEGVVCSYLTEDNSLIQFKVKGEKHSNSKVKTTKVVDTEKLDKLDACVEKICHSWRFEQMFNLANDTINDGVPDIKNIALFLKMLNSDTLKEELDIIAEFGFEPKDVLPKVSKIGKIWYLNELNKF